MRPGSPPSAVYRRREIYELSTLQARLSSLTPTFRLTRASSDVLVHRESEDRASISTLPVKFLYTEQKRNAKTPGTQGCKEKTFAPLALCNLVLDFLVLALPGKVLDTDARKKTQTED